MAIRKNKKRIDPRYFLDETTHRDLNEELDAKKAQNAVGIVLTKLKDAAPQGFIYSGIASVDPRTGKIGVRISPKATFVSHPGGTSNTYREEEKTIDPNQAISQLGNHMGLRRDLEKFGLSVSYFDEKAPLKFRFGGAMNRNNEFGGYVIKPADGVSEAGSFTTNMPDNVPRTADVMGRMTPDSSGVPEKYQELYSVMTSAPFNMDPKKSQQQIKACSDEALRGDLKADFVKCMYRKNTSNAYAMQDAGLVPQQKGR